MNLRTLLFSCLVLTAAAAQADVYRWTDDSGHTVYSQTPPLDGRPAARLSDPPPPAEDPETARKRLESQLETLEKAADARKKAAAEKSKAKKEKTAREERCRKARHNLRILESRPPNTLYKVGENEYRRFTVEELEAQRAKLRRIIEQDCD